MVDCSKIGGRLENLLGLIFISLLFLGSFGILFSPYFGVLCNQMVMPLVSRSTEEISASELIYAYIFLLTVVSWFIKRCILSRGLRYRDITRSHYAVIIFLSYCFLITLWSVSLGAGFLDCIRRWYTFSIFLLLFVISKECDTSRKVEILTVLLFSAILVNAIIGIAAPRQVDPKTYRLVQTKGIADASFIWGAIISFAILLHSEKPSWRLLSLSVFAVTVVRSIQESRRTPIVNELAGVLLVLFISCVAGRTVLNYKVIVIAVLLISFGAFFFLSVDMDLTKYNDRMDRIDPRSPSFQKGLGVRLISARNVLLSSLDHPIFGKGFVAEDEGIYIAEYRRTIRTVHNLYLFLLDHSGIVGLLLFVYMMLCFLRELLLSIQQSGSLFMYGLSIGGAAALVCYLLIFCMTSVRGDRIEVLQIIAVLAGLACANNLRCREKRTRGRGLRGAEV